MVQEDTTQILQNKVDKLKLLGLTDNLKNIIPGNQYQEDPNRDIALVRVLSCSDRIKEKFLEIRGIEFNIKTKEFVKITSPIMNTLGAYRYCKILKQAEEIEWASYSEEEINSRIIHFFEENIPYFLFYGEDYDLSPKDFNYIITTLQVFIDTSFHKSKSGKYINTLGRTYDEGIMRRALDTEHMTKKQEEGFLSKYNPFKSKNG